MLNIDFLKRNKRIYFHNKESSGSIYYNRGKFIISCEASRPFGTTDIFEHTYVYFSSEGVVCYITQIFNQNDSMHTSRDKTNLASFEHWLNTSGFSSDTVEYLTNVINKICEELKIAKNTESK